MRPVLPYTWVICYRATIGGPRNPSISLANTTLEHGLLLFEAKQSTAYATKRSLRIHDAYSCLHNRQLLRGVCRGRALSVGPFVVAAACGPVALLEPMQYDRYGRRGYIRRVTSAPRAGRGAGYVAGRTPTRAAGDEGRARRDRRR